MFQALSEASPLFIALACGVYYVGVLINCYKWQLALAIETISVPLPRLVRWYLIGALASNVLPTSVGGDVVRGYYAIRSVGQPMATSRSILAERLSGLLMTMFLAWIGLIVIADRLAVALTILLATMTGAICGAAAIRFAGRLPAWLDVPLQKIKSVAIPYFKETRGLAVILALSLLFQVLSGLGVWLNMRAVEVELPFLDVLLIVSIISVTSLLPISINGWGVSESLFLVLLAPFQVSSSGILAALLLGRALLFIVSLVGVVPLLLELKWSPPTQAVDHKSPN
jgi:uncharacterized membrane protein YbhN (UPF0104 family)